MLYALMNSHSNISANRIITFMLTNTYPPPEYSKVAIYENL